jgi:hypothetical protein
MRNWLFVSLSSANFASANISAPSVIQAPQRIAISFASDALAEFALTNGHITAVAGRVGRMSSRFSLEGCEELRNVRFDTVKLIRDDLRTHESRDSFSLLFDFGSDAERQHGQLPNVQLSYAGGVWTIAVVTRSTGENSSLSSPLCVAGNGT